MHRRSAARSACAAQSDHHPLEGWTRCRCLDCSSYLVCNRQSVLPRATPANANAGYLAARRRPLRNQIHLRHLRGIRCSKAPSPDPSSTALSNGLTPLVALPAADHPSLPHVPPPSPRHRCFSQRRRFRRAPSPVSPLSLPSGASLQPALMSFEASSCSLLHLYLGHRLLYAIAGIRSRCLCPWWRQNRRPFSPVRPFLHFHLAEKHCRSHC